MCFFQGVLIPLLIEKKGNWTEIGIRVMQFLGKVRTVDLKLRLRNVINNR